MKLPKTDSLILFAFLACVLLWAISKCSAKRSDLLSRSRDVREEEPEDRPQRRDSIALHPGTVQTTPSPSPGAVQVPPVSSPTPEPQPGNKPVRPALSPAPALTPATSPTTLTPKTSATPTAKPKTTPSEPKPKDNSTTLYVTIDGLKLRKTPSLKGDVITNLELYQAVEFMGKKSEKPEEISLGYEKVTDYWVKVRSKEGKEGWVFGAGVHYYKMKRKGVME